MKLRIVGSDGVFGSFLTGLLKPFVEFDTNADTVILAVPFSAYESVAKEHAGKHLVNVCSIQKPTTDICLKHSERVTSIHPLFGPRTPAHKRNALLTYSFTMDNDTWFSQEPTERRLIQVFEQVCSIRTSINNCLITPSEHDRLMAKTHLAAAMAADQMKVYVERAKDIPDEYIPHSFRLLREFVQTLEDMPKGTIESIRANPYA